MKKIFTILILSSLFAGELEVEGDLKVTGNIDANGNAITNVGNPINPTDAVNMESINGVVSNMMSLAGSMPPSKIYRYFCCNLLDIVIPNDKAWFIEGQQLGGNSFTIYINGIGITAFAGASSSTRNTTAWAFPGDNLSLNEGAEQYRAGSLWIYEYDITTSGEENGLQFIQP